jgi:nucleolar complex protein 3
MAQQHFVKSNAGLEWTYQVNVVIRAIDLMILTQRHVPLTRITALIRRLVQFAPHCPPHIAMSLLSLAHRLVLRYPGASSIFVGGSDHQFTGRGAFNPESDDINHSNAEGCFTWELPLLSTSYHPTEKDLAQSLIRHYHKVSKVAPGAPAAISNNLNAFNPLEVLEKFDSSHGDIVPVPQAPEARKRKRGRVQEENEEEDS